MPGVLAEIQEIFGKKSLYEILNVGKQANGNEIRKAYYQLSLKVHPDRVPKDKLENATKKFQALGKIYEVLSDANRRAVYDETGTVDDECTSVCEDRNWYDYWRLLFGRVKMKDIEEFEKKYKDSEEELEDLKSAYRAARGDMDKIIENMMCATIEDETRFRRILEDLIKDGTLTAYKAFTHERNTKQEARKRKATAEEKEAEDLRKKLVKSDESDLSALILRNQTSRGERAGKFFEMMEAKYGGKEKKQSGRSSPTKKTAVKSGKSSDKQTKKSQSSKPSPSNTRHTRSRK